MNHLTHDELVLTYYGEPDLAARRDHLEACAECRAELGRLARVLDQVTPFEVPEPDPQYEARVWDRLQWRLRAAKKRSRGADWMTWTAAAAIVAMAFLAGLFWNRRQATMRPAASIARNVPAPTATPVGTAQQQQQARDRVLLVIVGDHFDESERVLIELTNLAPTEGADISAERVRAEELLASNRLYRQNAAQRGEENVATLLAELEPVLIEITHAPAKLSAAELRSIQRRVEKKELVFKLRVVRAGVRATALPHLQTNV